MESVNYKIEKLSDKIIEFCKRNGISIEELEKISELELSKNEKLSSINPIIQSYGIIDIGGTETKEVSIGDVAGWRPYKEESNLFGILGKCYTDESSPYKYGTRANDKLGMSKEQILSDIQKSNSQEEVELQEVEGKLLVSHNGCHRTSLMKLLYADEVTKGDRPIEDINEKYKINAKVVKFDTTLTYIHYLLSTMKVIKYMKIEYDERAMPTGKYLVDLKDNTQAKLSRDEIINLFNEELNKNTNRVDLDSINKNLNIPSFREFLKENVTKGNEYGNSGYNM